MDNFFCEMPEHFLFGTVVVRVVRAGTDEPLVGVVVRVADSQETARGLG
jgi:hypothetical protein